MRITLLYAAYGWLLTVGLLVFAIDVVAQRMRRKRAPGPETTLYYGLYSAYALGQVVVALLALLALRRGPPIVAEWPGLLLGLLAAAGWVAIAVRTMEYRQPRIVAAIFAVLLIVAAFAAAPIVPETRYLVRDGSAAPRTATQPYTLGAVASADGTRIGYRQIGSGPGLILVQGAMGTAHNYDQLARSLAGDFTVYIPDRRGRGMSPRPYSPDHSIQRDVEDIQALITKTGTTDIFGLSSGAVITIEATRVLPAIRKAALYEPPFYLDGMPLDRVARFHGEVARNDLGAALATAGSIVGLEPAFFKFVPRTLKEVATNSLIDGEREGAGAYAPLHTLIPAMRYDFNVVAGMDGRIARFRSVGKDVLLLGGTESPEYLKAALGALHTMLPKADRVEFEGLDHSGAWNADRGGHPEIVAAALRRFFRDDGPGPMGASTPQDRR